MKILDNDEIMKWYGLIQQCKESGMTQKEFCDIHQIEFSKFRNMYYRIAPKSKKIDWYDKNVAITRRYHDSGETAVEFSKDNDISVQHLYDLSIHLRYLDIIESELEKREKPMSFHMVPAGSSLTLPVFNLPSETRTEPNMIEARNNIELVITKGVKVIVSPEIGVDTFIKIIELLKDL